MKYEELIEFISDEYGNPPGIDLTNRILEFAESQYQAGYEHAFDKFADDSYVKDFIYGKKEDWS